MLDIFSWFQWPLSSLVKCLFQSFVHFLLGLSSWLDFFSCSGNKSFIRYTICNYCLPACSLSFCFFNGISHGAKVYYLEEVSFISFFIMDLVSSFISKIFFLNRGIFFLSFFLFFYYLFGCTGSQLQRVESSIFRCGHRIFWSSRASCRGSECHSHWTTREVLEAFSFLKHLFI